MKWGHTMFSLSLSLSLIHTHTHTSILLYIWERLVAWSKPIHVCCAQAHIHEEPVDRCSSNLHSSYHREEEEVQHCITKKKKKSNMNTHMGSALPTENLDRAMFLCWGYKMHQYLVAQGYWSYIQGSHAIQPNTRRLLRMGACCKPCVVLPCVMRSWSHARPYSWVKNAERTLGQSQEDFRSQHGYM